MLKQRIYNTLTRKVEVFEPFDSKFVKVYVCGPTPYDFSHIGHARTFVFFDTAIKWLREQGYTVFYIMNITDIDDKMINRSLQLGIPWKDFKEIMIQEFYKDMESLNINAVSMYVRATDVIPEMIEFIKKLIEKGYAYVTPDGVYYDVSKFKDYGKLSGININELTQHRIEPSPYKRNPADFALWKLKKYDYEPSWSSPWGEGRPGWHIECSTMILKYLGEQIDIHGGGADLIFPHHENEIAQSEAYTGKQFVKYWMHVGLVNIKGEKMSKSLGNIVLVRELLREYDTNTIRWYILATHYRKPLEFSWEDLEKYKKMVEKIRVAEKILSEIDTTDIKLQYFGKINEKFRNIINKIEEALYDDFNTAAALSAFYQLLTEIEKAENNLSNEEKIKLLHYYIKFRRVFGFVSSRKNIEQKLLEIIAEVRNELRSRKMYELSDKIRAELVKLGYRVADTKNGTKIY